MTSSFDGTITTFTHDEAAAASPQGQTVVPFPSPDRQISARYQQGSNTKMSVPGSDMRGATLPTGYMRKSDGIYVLTDDDEEGAGETWLCSPIALIALPRQQSGQNWSQLFEFVDRDGACHELIVPSAKLASKAADVCAQFQNLGLKLAPGPKSRSAFIGLLQSWDTDQRRLLTARLGWTDTDCRSFVMGSGSVLGDQAVIFDNPAAKQVAAEMRSIGSMDSWRAGGVAKLVEI